MDKKTKTYLLVVLTIISALFSCGSKESSSDIVVLYTTDVHGVVVPYNFHHNTPRDVSLANASTLIKQVREEYGKNLLLIDGGDLYQGTPAMYYYNFYSTEENHLISRVVNYLKYNALIIGNHDLETGGAYVDSLNKQLRMPRFGANVIDTRIKRARYRPYKIFEIDGFKIAVYGLITPETVEQVPRTLIPYMDFQSMLQNATRWVKAIHENENPDYLICVMHAGIKEYDFINSNNDTIHDGLTRVIENIPGIDLVLFGHDHGVYNDIMVNPWGDSVRVFQSAAYSEEIGRIDIHLSRKNKVLTKTTKAERINLKEYPADEEYVDKFKGVIDTVNAFLDRPLGILPEDLDMPGTLYKQTNTIDLIHRVQLDATGADISLCSALSAFMDLNAGNITYRTVFKLYKYDNQLHKMWMSGEDVKNFLEWGYGRQYGRMTDENSHLLGFQYDKQGKIIYGRWGPELITPQYNFTSAAGINYTVDVRKPVGSRVKILSMADGTPFDLARHYTVAISSYQAAGGGGFINRGVGWSMDDIAYHTLSVSKKTISKLISEYLGRGAHLAPQNIGKWKVIPEEWAAKAGPADADLLIPYIRK